MEHSTNQEAPPKFEDTARMCINALLSDDLDARRSAEKVVMDMARHTDNMLAIMGRLSK